jgi:hypothetical protein
MVPRSLRSLNLAVLPLRTDIDSSDLREAVGGRDHVIRHLIATGMPGTDEMEFGPDLTP